MLADKDRIFTNLYGLHDWGLDGARKRGCWVDVKSFIAKGRDWMVNEVKARRGISHRTQVVVHAEAGWRASTLSRRQCR
jgi:hypothetical protein